MKRRDFLKLASAAPLSGFNLGDGKGFGFGYGGFSAPSYTPNAVAFNGTDAYLNHGSDFIGNADGKLGIVSFWAKVNADGALYSLIDATGPAFYVRRLATNVLQLQAQNSGGSTRLRINSATNLVAADGWTHFLYSWNLGITACAMYRNGVVDHTIDVCLDDNLDYTRSAHSVGGTTAGTSLLNGCLADVYINWSETVVESDDTISAANIAKFYDSGPVSLGADGSLPTGSASLVMLSDDFSSFGSNGGTGGDYTVNGTLSVCGDAP